VTDILEYICWVFGALRWYPWIFGREGVRNKMANYGREKPRFVNIIVKLQRETV